ncbi:hypothetical protein PHJA_002133600 [Phtheirospermum japonicum]|uniref:Uncharacterized protein n=1 Tax=Phtheirospermum japonicum TaxID=374723 RepID=A0A830CXU0_9LAMI|nr:hypothetical protein PHJA_002133600 [Phtheirospermum japonicum]
MSNLRRQEEAIVASKVEKSRLPSQEDLSLEKTKAAMSAAKLPKLRSKENAVKISVALLLPLQQEMDPDLIFPPGSFCSMEEVLIPRKLQQKRVAAA